MTKYEVILFDLDHTLWDHERNSLETLNELHEEYNLSDLGIVNFELFQKEFSRVNNLLWANYNKGHVDREYIRNERFERVFKTFKIKDSELAKELSNVYIFRCPKKSHLFPHTFSTLDYLSEKYDLFLLTNGFDEIQEIKITYSKLKPYFKGMVTSETCGYRKPQKEVFDYTVKLAKTSHKKSIMVGDNLNADIGGARNAKIDTIYFNPNRLPHKQEMTYEVSCLSELPLIL